MDNQVEGPGGSEFRHEPSPSANLGRTQTSKGTPRDAGRTLANMSENGGNLWSTTGKLVAWFSDVEIHHLPRQDWVRANPSQLYLLHYTQRCVHNIRL